MSDVKTSSEKVTCFLEQCDKNGLLLFINENKGKESLFKNVKVFHTIVRCLDQDPSQEKVVMQLIYLLTLHGADINMKNLNGDIALLVYLKEVEQLSDNVVQAFLRCGSDVTLKNKVGEDALQHVLQTEQLPRQVKARVLEYMPGIWRAVEADDAMTVRRLINQWCSIHVEKDDMTVLQLAFNKGTENIIRVISGIGSSMDLVHAVLAGDVKSVKTILESSSKYNINLKNMGDRGATPLFYAMCENDQSMVDMLIQHGARLDICMQGEMEMELPLYFAALSHIPSVSVEVLKHTIPTTPIHVDVLYYKGRNVLFYCIENDVDISLFEAILHKCSATVLTQINQDNLDARCYAQKLAKSDYAAIIEKIVNKWLTDDGCHEKRNFLALHGYHFTPSICWGSDPNRILDKSAKFFQILPKYEEYKSKLKQAVEDGDLISVKEMLYSESWSSKGLTSYFADARVVGDGQPLLHKAVLRRHVDIVREIAECLVHKCHLKLDSVKDQYFRTTYHYANGMEDGKELVFLLEDMGMSEFAMDKDGRSPLAFKDRKGQREMKALITYQTLQDFGRAEPDPWSTPLTLPIIGYLAKCVHEHKNKNNIDHSQSNTSTGQEKSIPDNINEQMYTKINPNDFYQANKSVVSSNVTSGTNRVTEATTRETDHYQILDISHSSTNVTENGYSNNGYYGYDINGAETTTNCDEDDIQDGDGYSEAVDGDSNDQDLIEDSEGDPSHSTGECSDSDHQSSGSGPDDEEQEEDYDGDYSDLESEEEKEVDKLSNYCVIL